MVSAELSTQVIRPDFAFLAAVEKASHQPVSSCYRCLKCSAGCPMAGVMDCPPDRAIRMIQLGLKDELLRSNALWLCTSCMTCSDRCPNGIDVARVWDTLRQMAVAEGYPAGEPRVAAFHVSFLGVVKRYGRLHEATLIAQLKLKTHDWLGDLGSGLGMFVRGKIPLLPQRVRERSQVGGLFQAGSSQRGASSGEGGIG